MGYAGTDTKRRQEPTELDEVSQRQVEMDLEVTRERIEREQERLARETES